MEQRGTIYLSNILSIVETILVKEQGEIILLCNIFLNLWGELESTLFLILKITFLISPKSPVERYL